MPTTGVSPNSILRLILGLAGTAVILFAMRLAAPIVNMVLMAALLTLLFVPLYNWLQRKGLKSGLALLIVFLVVALVGLGVLALFGVAVVGLVQDRQTYEAQLTQQVSQLQQTLQAKGIDASTYTSAIESAGKQLLGMIVGVAANMTVLIANGAFILLIFGYMLAESNGLVRRLQRNVDPNSIAFASAAQAVPSVVKFLVIISIFNLIIAILDTIFLWFLGVPYPILWGVFAFVFGFIPYLGYWISMLPPLILAFAQSGITGAITVLLGYWFINGILSSVVAPRYFGKGLNVSPVLTLLAVIFWGWLLGPVGAIVGVPMTVLLKLIVLENYPETRWLAQALSQDGDDSELELPMPNPQA